MKMAVFWVAAPCSLVDVYNVSEILAISPDDGGSKNL
jgi:hypothetical protein